MPDCFLRTGMGLAPMHDLPDIDAVVEQIGQSPDPEPDPACKLAVGKLALFGPNAPAFEVLGQCSEPSSR